MRAHGILSSVPDPVFRRLSCCMTTFKFPARHLVCIEGNPCHHVASIRKGQVKLYKHGSNGRTQVIGTFGPGFLLGYEALHDRPYQSSAEALTDIEVCAASREDMASLIGQFPDVALGLVGFLCHRISQLESQTLVLGTFSAGQRLAAYLLSAHESTAPFGHRLPATLNLSRQELADTLGMARETLIRLLNRFATEGLIALRGSSILVREPQTLAHMLSGAA